MKLNKLSILAILIFAISVSCGEKDSNPELSVSHNISNGKISINDTLKIVVNGLKIDTEQDYLSKLLFTLKSGIKNIELKPINVKNEYHFSLELLSLGKKELIIKSKESTVKIAFTLLNDKTPEILDYKIINTFPRQKFNYTQGFEFHNDTLYESVGQYGRSKLLKVNYKNGQIFKEIKLPSQYFAEGLTILDDKIHLLTWKEKVGFIYDTNFNKIKSFNYNLSKEGWGICNDKKHLYKSDGTEKIWKLDSKSQNEESYIEVYTNKNKVVGLNELEWINGKIFANRYLFNGIAIINPKNGAVESVINLSTLKNKVTQHKQLDVINGIAYNSKRKTIFVTGKMWDKVFEIKIINNE